MKPLTVLHVEAGMHLYGGALQVVYLLRGLHEAGVRNVLVCPRGSAIAQAARPFVEQVYEVPLRGDADLPFIFALRRIMRETALALVHLHSRRGADVLGGLAARLAGVPCILTRRVDNPEPPWLVRWKYRLYARVITISEGIREVLRREGVPQEKLICVRSAVDAEKYQRACEREWFEAEFTLPGNARVLGVIAQFIQRKGHRYLLAALPEILTRYPDVQVLCFGKGPLEESLWQEMQQPEYQGRVRLAGFRDDLERVLPCLYAVVHPAEMEGLGVSLLQAAAAGVPIIAARAGGIPEAVRHEKNGLLVPPGDVSALRAALERVLADPAQAARFGAAGRELAAREFSIPVMVAGNLAVYGDVVREMKD